MLKNTTFVVFFIVINSSNFKKIKTSITLHIAFTLFSIVFKFLFN